MAGTTSSRTASHPVPRVVLGFSGIGQYPVVDGDPEKPSDVQIAVGPGAGRGGRIVEVTNNGIQIFDKTGTSVAGPVSLEQFVGASADTCFDPRILYDQHSGRFVAVMPGTKNSETSRLHVAVSRTSAPANLTDEWVRVQDSAATRLDGKNTWIDYPAVGSDRNALYVAGNMADDNKTHRGVKIRVFDKEALLSGNSRFRDLDLSAALPGGGVSTLQPAHVSGRTDSGNFYLVSRCGADAYRLWEIAGGADAPRILSSEPRPWNAGLQVREGAPQKGQSDVKLHTSSGKVMNALYRDGSVWCSLASDMDGDGTTEIAWFRIPTRGGHPAVPEVTASGVVDGELSGDWTLVPSIGVNASGRAVICYTQTSAARFAEMRVVAFDPEEMSSSRSSSSSLLVRGSIGEYDGMDRHNPEKWADYCSVVVDPDDGNTFWVAHEVCVVARREGDDAQWGTWIARLTLSDSGEAAAASEKSN